ncbi:hypothetical protein D3C86_1066890 [compost metagenome]
MSDKKTAKEKLFDRVENVLNNAEIDPLVIKRVREQFFPPAATGLQRPQKRQFRAAVLQPRTPGFVRSNEYYYWFELADVTIEPEKDYRLVELPMIGESDPDWALLITPKGCDTLAIKNAIFYHGGDEMLKANPSFELRQMKDLDKRERIGAYRTDVPRIMYSRRKIDGGFREGGIIYPRGYKNA